MIDTQYLIALKRCAALSVAHLSAGPDRRNLTAVTEAILDISASLHRALIRLRTKFLFILPGPVFCRILRLVSLKDRLSVSHTCRILRDRCLAEPQLWRTIVVTPRFYLDSLSEAILESDPLPQMQYDGALQLLNRSGTLDSRLYAVLSVERWPRHTEAFIRAALSRVSVLKIEPFQCYHVPQPIGDWQAVGRAGAAQLDVWSAFSQSLREHAPALRSLQIVFPRIIHSGIGTTHTLPPDILAGDSSQIHTCLLRGLRLPSETGCFALSRLTVFDYDPGRWYATADEVDEILILMPHLEILGLTMAHFSHWGAGSSTQEIARPLLSVILTFTFAEESKWHLMDALAHLRNRTPARIALEAREFPILGGLASCLPEGFGSPTAVAIKHGLTLYRAGNFSASFLLFGGVPFLSRTVYARVTSLTIAEEYWPPPPWDAEAANLTRLCILLRTCWTNLRSDAVGLFVKRSESPLHCPILDEFEIACPRHKDCAPNSLKLPCSCSAACTICLRDVREFISSNLRYACPRLHRVIISGVQAVVDPDPATEFIALQAMADEVDISELESEKSAAIRRECEVRLSHRWVPTQVFSDETEVSFDVDDALGATPVDSI